MLLALVTVVCMVSALSMSKGTQVLMPGPLSSAHGAIETCSACHTQSGSGKLSWVRGLLSPDPHADSKACLACHNMPDTAFNAHGASAGVILKSSKRLTKAAEATPAPFSARAQDMAFPTHGMAARLYCATCHQEHQGAAFDLGKISNEQCRSCHVVRFDSFDGNHPRFQSYPFERRTRIVFDHAGHFDRHYPEIAKKEPAKRIPATCSTCHNSGEDRRVMALAPFDQTCAGCHLDQIVGKERAQGPKGIAFLALPGLDVQTLKEKSAAIGEWPDASEAALTPFMRVMIGRTERGRALLQIADNLSLQDLAKASDDEIKAVANLAWEIKALIHALLAGKVSDVLGDLDIGSGGKLSAGLVADLTASIPRDVVSSAQQQWLPNLATEMANRKVTSDDKGGQWAAIAAEPSAPSPSSPERPTAAQSRKSAPGAGVTSADGEAKAEERTDEDPRTAKADAGGEEPKDPEPPRKVKLDPPPCVVSIFGQCLVSKGSGGEAKPAGSDADKGGAVNAGAGVGNETLNSLPGAMRAGLADAAKAAAHDSLAVRTGASVPSSPKAADQTDDLLSPTAEELREMKAILPDRPAGAPAPSATSQADTGAAPATTESPPAPSAPRVIGVASDIDPESWAEYGGWYHQDYAIFYRPAGHKDKFVYSWLVLTGPHAPEGDKSPSTAVFDFLTGKDAQGSCAKCHSVDDIPDNGRMVNFSPPSVKTKQGRFTHFVHEPHFGIMDKRGCLTCHELAKDQSREGVDKTGAGVAKPKDAEPAGVVATASAAPPEPTAADRGASVPGNADQKAVSRYLKSYEQGNPHTFTSNFADVKKDLCQTCHTAGMARQDCLLCHRYHVNEVITPIISTKVPAE